MLSQKHRLSKSADVKKTTARGRSFFNPLFVIKFLPGGDEPRITVIASVKVSKKAVERNRVKRILRDELSKHVRKFRAGDYAFIVKAQAIKVPPTELRQALIKSLTVSKIIQ